MNHWITWSIAAWAATYLPATSAMAEDEYEAWLKQNQPDFQQAQQEFQDYLDENDREFIGFLKQQWKEVEIKKPTVRDTKPKPVAMPTAPPVKAQPRPITPPQPIIDAPISEVKPDTKPSPNVEPTPKTTPKPTPVLTEKPKPKPVTPTPILAEKPQPKPVLPPPITQASTAPVITFDYYGYRVSIREERRLKQRFRGRINNESIADYWQKLASQPHQKPVKDLKHAAKTLGLNDWSTALLFDQYARQLHPHDDTSRQLTTWFLLVKGGYNARLAYNQKAYLLMPSKQPLFGVTYFRFAGERYYAVSLNDTPVQTGKAFTYSGKHSAGALALDFSEPNRFAGQGKQAVRDLSFQYQQQTYNVKVTYTESLVAYLNTYPQLSLDNYFSAGLPEATAQQLLSQLRPIVADQTEEEAVNRLLRFVQTAFDYKTDQDQFRQENYLFPLETLHYPFSDCEDRAALFAWLTKSLLHLDVVMLDFPGHIAAAVAFNGKVKGDNWRYNGKTYTVTDPTYINSTVGMTMPNFKRKKPKIVAF